MKKFITYQLFIEVNEFLTLTVGKLGGNSIFQLAITFTPAAPKPI
jgi:hypothetical protein